MEELIEKLRIKIFRFVLAYVKDPSVADDLTQDVLLKVWMNRSRIQGLEQVDSYVMMMAKNHVMDHFKKLAKEKLYQEEVWRRMQVSEDRIESEIAARDMEIQLESILRALPERQQQVMDLSLYEGLSLNEIADKLEIAPNTAKNHFFRALKVVRSRFNPRSLLLLVWLGMMK